MDKATHCKDILHAFIVLYVLANALDYKYNWWEADGENRG